MVTVVNSGFAITAANEAARNCLLEEVHRLESDLEAASKWISVHAPNVPDRLHSDGNPTVPMKPGDKARLEHIAIPVTKEMVMEEATLKTGVTPISARVLASNIDRPASDWAIHFPSRSPKLGERLFEESGRLTIFHRKPRIAQCDRCWGYHSTKICSRAERCTRCSLLEHKLDACKQEISRCMNYHGPHRADDPNCMARPDRANGKIIIHFYWQLQMELPFSIAENSRQNLDIIFSKGSRAPLQNPPPSRKISLTIHTLLQNECP
ncbi:hypothetical protein K3495_g10778, partial [Podosphaera aphanis]